MLKVKFGERVWQLDETAALTMGDLVALREMGVSPSRFEVMLNRLNGVDMTNAPESDLLELATAAAQTAYLAAVREDHSLSWRDFAWSLPMDDLQAFEIDSGEATPKPPALRPVETAGVGDALAAATVKPSKTRRTKVK